MPLLTIHPHVRWADRIEPKFGYSGMIPSAANTGVQCQRAVNHLRHWRAQPWFAGVYPPQSGLNDLTGNYYVIVHAPPRISPTARQCVVAMARWGTTSAGAWFVAATEDAFGSATSLGNIWSGTDPISTIGFTEQPLSMKTAIFDLEPPSGTGGSAFEVLQLRNSNQYLAAISCWWAPTLYLNEDQLEVLASHVSPERLIQSDRWGKIYEQIGDGSIEVDYCERMTRRTWFNWSHSSGILIPASTAKTNIFGSYVFPCRARNIDGTSTAVTSYPAAVISATAGAAGDAILYFDCSGDSWSYTVQAAEFGTGPFLVTYDRTGASDTTGLDVLSSGEDTCTVSAETDASITLTVHSVGLFEGSGYTA